MRNKIYVNPPIFYEEFSDKDNHVMLYRVHLSTEESNIYKLVVTERSRLYVVDQ